MNKYKAKCEVLKKIRKSIADKINIDLHQRECTFEGDCTGTCPKCKQEEDILNRELAKRAGALALGVTATLALTSCGPTSNGLPEDIQGGLSVIEEDNREGLKDTFNKIIENLKGNEIQELSGDVVYVGDNFESEQKELNNDYENLENEEDKLLEDEMKDLDTIVSELEGDIAFFDEDEENVETNQNIEIDSNEKDKNNEDLFPYVTAGVLPYDGNE